LPRSPNRIRGICAWLTPAGSPHPRGWELVRHAGPLPSHPDEDDLVALADAVREGRDGAQAINGVAAGFSDPATGVHGGALMAPAARRPEPNGRRRGHLRVLPDPSD